MTQDEIIETKAAWGKTFVEIIDPTKENHVFRAYFEQPQREWVGLTVEDAVLAEREACAEICKKHADVYAMLEQNPTAKSAWAACIDNLDAIRARGQA